MSTYHQQRGREKRTAGLPSHPLLLAEETGPRLQGRRAEDGVWQALVGSPGQHHLSPVVVALPVRSLLQSGGHGASAECLRTGMCAGQWQLSWPSGLEDPESEAAACAAMGGVYA